MSVIDDDRSAGERFPPLLTLARLAKSRQHGMITQRQYIRLERKYLHSRAKRRAGQLMAWYYQHRSQLKSELKALGVTIRPETPGRVHAYHLTQRGFGRLTEIEGKIEKSRKKRIRNSGTRSWNRLSPREP